MTKLRLSQIDAFTTVAFRGNPAAVVQLPGEAPADWMQQVAAEMNLSETAFVRPLEPADDCPHRYGLRWFTPQVEVDLCGHATLATAHALWTDGVVEAGAGLAFETRSGTLHATQRDGWIELDFPRRDALGMEPPDGLIEALGVMPSFVGRTGDADVLVVLDEEEAVHALQPDLALLAGVEARGVIVTAPAEASRREGGSAGGVWDFVSRFFGPRVGVPEDPVTGSAHCALGPYWARRLKRNELVGFQASARGGLVRVRVELERVFLGGQAVTVFEGQLLTSW